MIENSGPALPPIIDLRTRPRFLHDFFGASRGTQSYETVRWLNRRLGSEDVDHFERAEDLPAFLAEMRAAGIAAGVVVARSTPDVRVTNEAVAALVGQSSGRLIGVGSVDVVDLTTADIEAEAERAVRDLGLSGLNFDPGFYRTAIRHDDDRLMRAYALCETLGVPAFVLSGPTTPDLRYNDPLAIDVVAKTFPGLPIVCCHGFYPNIDGMFAVAFRRENVFVSPDMYLFAPGGSRYFEAAEGFLRDQLLFGTSYPFRPMQQGVRDLARARLSPRSLQAVTFRNAGRLFAKVDATKVALDAAVAAAYPKAS